MKFLLCMLLLGLSICHAQPSSAPGALQPQEAAQVQDLRARILRNLKVGDEVPDSARAEVEITYDEIGSITALRFIHSSGYKAYDSAIEDAVYKAAPVQLTPRMGPDGTPVRRVFLTFAKSLK